MTENLPAELYRGTRGFLPEEMSIRPQVFHRLYEVIESFGYERYDGPTLEPVQIYEAKTSQETAEQQLYTLTDRSGRRLALRPEMTPSVARMIAANLGRLTFPVRWYSHPNCLVRSFCYYTSTVFEVFDTHPDNRRSLFGGGRYNNSLASTRHNRYQGMGDVTLMDLEDWQGRLPRSQYRYSVARQHG